MKNRCGIQCERSAERERGTDRQIDRQTDRDRDRQTQREIDRRTEFEDNYMYIEKGRETTINSSQSNNYFLLPKHRHRNKTNA